MRCGHARISLRERVNLDFNTFSDCHFYELFLEPADWDVGGGKITIEEIDIIKEYPGVKHIAISGLYQDTFEYFVKTYGNQFEAICFWKNKLVSDWSLLSYLENVECICYFFNQRLEHFWDMSNNKKLKYLSIDDFSRLKDYSGIEKAPTLEGVNFGNKVWARTELSHFPDMSQSTLKYVIHNAKISMYDAYNILKSPFLEQFDFDSGTYPTEFIAWVCANYPHIQGFCLKPYIDHGDGYISVTGKRKKTFDATTEKGMKMKINAVDKFEKMLSEYKGMTFDEIVSIFNKSKEVMQKL